jgi:hypothetical protein
LRSALRATALAICNAAPTWAPLIAEGEETVDEGEETVDEGEETADEGEETADEGEGAPPPGKTNCFKGGSILSRAFISVSMCSVHEGETGATLEAAGGER